MKTYAIEIMGQDEITYVTQADVAKLFHETNNGARLVYVGGDFINPNSIQRIRRAYDVDASVIKESDQELISSIYKEPKKLN
jgi:hypothetical protein